ncbi:uncharacterized protein [Lepeophtheirus salmonis]|uniref:uncharacterized protein n=1 Tax=Lepeophtheirus salmonis TaxID=72036 RepID=UPI001AEB2B03|nr:regulation of nuclear pre-mRNA domain-containing protein 2-like [Lepeophtheirus salmonis]XP_040572033.1 regulation of nuclear pre-mRNA domain-containing protein 2-like [Lepeophtheirus salmonis]XP_040572034.1 regulation of nuclear pre-mRNA domain-containing protein 2-like [Lepeophtheirus salmonis]XP_040572035.1 regulation of nuclear pre-mRNA domain-containing protein 2-like [Lepeophtheirus salmonis]XP_040572036.1 regulation of nuclear pre-mRNA domain-containing protein 2-like [Lepeophtheirus 
MSSSSSTLNSGGGFEETKFMKDLINLRDTQEAIQSYSAWCIKHRKAAYKIARCWLKIVKKVRVDQKLTLFYLLNDIVQHCRRKNYSEFLMKFESVLKEAMPHLRDDKINEKLLRCINIWSERNVFSESFLDDIKAIILEDKETEEIDNFQPTQLCTQIKIMKALEDDTDYKLKTLKDSEINIMDIDSLRQTLKDRQDGNDFISDFEKSTNKMQDYIKAIDKELGKRRKVIELLSNGGKYYESLLGEANIVANAYTNFEKRLLNLKRKLGEKIPDLEQNPPPPPVTDSLSPIPSPDYDAPSPVNDEYELKLPGEDNYYDPASSHSTSSTSDTTDGAKSSKTVIGKSSNSPGNGSRDLNQRLNSIMSSSENNCSSANAVPNHSNTDKNFSISEFLTRLAEGKPVGKYNNPPSINGAGYDPLSEKVPTPVEPPLLQNHPIQQPTLSHHQLPLAQPVPMPVQHPLALVVKPPQAMPLAPPHSLSEQTQQTLTAQPPLTHSIPSHGPPLHSDQSSGSSDWWNTPPPPPPPPLPVPAQQDSQSEIWPEPWEEPIPEWKIQPEDDVIESENDLIRPYNNREPILSTSCSYPLKQNSSEIMKNNLISLVSGPSSEVDMDVVVDSDHDDHQDQSGSGSQSLSLQDRLRNLAGIPVTLSSTPEKNEFKSPPLYPSPHQGPNSNSPSWENSKKIRSNNFNHFHRGNRGSPYRGRGGRGFNSSFDRDHGSGFDRGRGNQRGFRGGRW